MNILVTGGSSGLGRAIVRALAEEGHNVLFTYALSADSAAQLAQEFANARSIHCDFTDSASVDSLMEQVANFDIDVLVNNARGPIHEGHFFKLEPEIFLESFTSNVLQTLRITQAAIRHMRKKKFGKIINIITSYVVNKPPTGYSEYVASKAYLLSMSKSWANECIRFNITSNSVSPSFMLTGLTSETDERMVEQMKDAHPLRTLLVPDDAAQAVKFLVAASQQINGTNMVINAGADVL